MTKPRSVAATANDNSIPGSRLVSGSITDSQISSTASVASTKLSFTQTGSTDVRSVQSKLEDVVSVLDFIPQSEHAAIASGTSTYDAATDFQAAVDTGKVVYVPKGTYRVNSTIELFSDGTITNVVGKSLLLGANATIRSDASPVVHLRGNNNSLKGTDSTSVIFCTGAATKGAVLVGQQSTTDTTNTFYNTVSDLRIRANDAFGAATAFQFDYTAALMLFNAETFGSNSATYYNKFRNLVIQDAKEGILMAGTCNANFFHEVLFWRVGHTALHFFAPHPTDGAGTRYGYNWNNQTLSKTAAECVVSDCFVDTSFLAYNTTPGYASRTFSDGQPYPAQGTMLRFTGHSVFHQLTNFSGEPGAGTSYEIAADTTRTYIQGAFNVTTGTNSAQFVTSGTTIVANGGGVFNQITASTEALIYRMRMMATGSAAAPAIFDRFQTGTGISFPTPGSMIFSSSGSEILKTSAAGLTINNGPIWTSGSGDPEGVVTAPVGSLYTRTDGGVNSTLYVKEAGTGNTGWVAK